MYLPAYNFVYWLNKLLTFDIEYQTDRSRYPELDDRLFAAASYVRPGARFCDIGTDHAYLPLALVREGRAECALACDVNEGPCRRALNHIAEAGRHRIRVTPESAVQVGAGGVAVMLTDGLRGVEGFAPTDIAAAGMGGELIIQILSASEYIRDEGVRLILQPMTRASKLRLWLYSSGFEAIGENIAESDGRLYQIICAQYTGVVRELTGIEALCGIRNIENRTESFRKFVLHELKVNRSRLDGLRRSSGGAAGAEETALLCSQLEELLK